MGVEVATYISQLNSSNPLGTDQRSTADDHLRLIKTTLGNSFPNFSATSVDSTCAELNKLSGHTGSVPELGTAQEWTAQQNFDLTSISYSATITWNLTTAQVGAVTLTGNTVLAAPSNQKAGATYILKIAQDGTGGHTMTFNSAFNFPFKTAPTISDSAGDVSVISFVSDGTNMYGSALLDVG